MGRIYIAHVRDEHGPWPVQVKASSIKAAALSAARKHYKGRPFKVSFPYEEPPRMETVVEVEGRIFRIRCWAVVHSLVFDE